MNNLNLKSKLILLLLLPVFGLLFLSITISYDRYLIYTKLEMLNKAVFLSTKAKNLIYSLQKERGYSNGYIGSNGINFKNKIITQQKETKKYKEELNSVLKTMDLDYYKNEFKKSINNALSELNHINSIRGKILSLTTNEDETNTYYTNLINDFIEIINKSTNISNNATLTRQLYAYSNFIYIIERTAKERGLGTLAYSSKEFSLDMKNKIQKLITEQHVYFDIFSQNIDKDSIKYYNDTFKGHVIDESIRMRDNLLNSIEKKLIVSQVNRLVGYGNIVHDLDNRDNNKEDQHSITIKRHHTELIKLINQYKSINHISTEESKLLNTIKNIFTLYMQEDTDPSLLINNETKVLKALNDITYKNFFLDNSSYWFNTMTKKISLLQKIDIYLTNKIYENAKIISNDAEIDMNSYIILCLIIILAVLIIGRNIGINIVNSVNELLQGIDRFFKFVNKKNTNIELINIKSNDEIAVIAKMINEKILISKKIIDEDIIERTKQLEIEVKKKTYDLKKTNKEFEILLERFNIHTIATRTDTQGTITYVTDKFCKLSGYSKEELIGQNHNIVRDPTLPKDTYKKLWEIIQSGKVYTGELKNRRKDGSIYWIKLIIVPEFNSQGTIIGYFSVKENIDDKIKIREFNTILEEKIEKAIQESRKKDELLSYQSKLAVLGEMIGIIAHQWKQPLSSLAMRIQTIKYKKFSDSKNIEEEYLNNFVNENMQLIQFMSKTIDDFRDFFRQDKVKEDFNVHTCIEKTLNIIKPQLEEAHIKIVLKDDNSIANGLQSEFQQVIVNLISNARDILIEKEIKEKVIIINSEIEDEKVIISIEDNAGGIPVDIIDNIFEAYFTTKKVGKGTGIGLYISKTIIEDTMNGELTATNTANGACFKIILPK